MKRLQNRVAESRRLLPAALLYATAVWLLAGLVGHEWWIQFGLFVASVFLLMELNNRNLLIRIYSRSVSVTFIFLTCAATFLFPSWTGGFAQVCIIASLLLLYDSYQDRTAAGLIYYSFLLLGIGSIAEVRLLFYLPVFWLTMAALIYSFSWRTFLASLLGLLTPYWFLTGWILYQDAGDFISLLNHFAPLADFQFPPEYEGLPQTRLLCFATVFLLCATGSIHFLRQSFHDKIRVRQIYYSFMLLGSYAVLMAALQPQHSTLALRMLILAASIFFGHFFALTSTRLTNIAVWLVTVALILLTALNLWMPSLPS